MRIVIDLNEERIESSLDVHIKTMAHHILMDALYEFQSNRIGKHGSARNYVANRYDKSVYPEGERFEQKVQQVQRRCTIAEIIRCGNISVEW